MKTPNIDIKVKVEITWSKIMALLMLVLAAKIDLETPESNVVFIVAMPIVAAIITGKQYYDKQKFISNRDES